MTLQFEQNAQGQYECLLENVEHSFNLHIKREKPGSVDVLVCTAQADAEPEYDTLYSHYAEPVFDKDFKLLVFPKTIKVVSWSPVISAEVNYAVSEGGGGGGQIIVPGLANSVLYDDYASATSDGPTE